MRFCLQNHGRHLKNKVRSLHAMQIHPSVLSSHHESLEKDCRKSWTHRVLLQNDDSTLFNLEMFLLFLLQILRQWICHPKHGTLQFTRSSWYSFEPHFINSLRYDLVARPQEHMRNEWEKATFQPNSLLNVNVGEHTHAPRVIYIWHPD